MVVYKMVSIKWHNKRICGWVYYSFRSESYDSNLVLYDSGRDRSDPAAYAKHYMTLLLL